MATTGSSGGLAPSDTFSITGGCQCSLLRYRITLPNPALTSRIETNDAGTIDDDRQRIGFTHCYCSICRLSVSSVTRTALCVPFANVEWATRARLTEANARRHSESLSLIQPTTQAQETSRVTPASSQNDFANVDTPSGCCTNRGSSSSERRRGASGIRASAVESSTAALQSSGNAPLSPTETPVSPTSTGGMPSRQSGRGSTSQPSRVSPGLHIIPEQGEAGNNTCIISPVSPIQTPPLALSRVNASSAYHRRVWRRDTDVGGGCGGGGGGSSNNTITATDRSHDSSPTATAAPVNSPPASSSEVSGGKGKGFWNLLTGSKTGKGKESQVRGANVVFNLSGGASTLGAGSRSGTAAAAPQGSTFSPTSASAPASAPGSRFASAPTSAAASRASSAPSTPPASSPPSPSPSTWLGLRRGSAQRDEITYRTVSTAISSPVSNSEQPPDYFSTNVSSTQTPASPQVADQDQLEIVRQQQQQQQQQPQQPAVISPDARRLTKTEVLRWETMLLQQQEDDEHDQPEEAFMAPWPFKEFQLFSRDGNDIYRGFCSWCGGSLVLRCEDIGPGSRVYIQAGTLDDPGFAINILGFIRETFCVKAMPVESGGRLGTVSGIANNELKRYKLGYENANGELMDERRDRLKFV